MPDFEQRKRKTMTDQELYDEYNNGGASRKKTAAKKNTGKNSSKSHSSLRRDALPVSPERKKMQEELKQKQQEAKKSKTYVGKTTGKKPVSSSPSYHKTKSKEVGRKNGVRNGGNNRKKKKTGKYTLYYVLIGILAVATFTVLSTTVLFNISNFVVSGETVYSDEEIINACGIEKGENLLRIDVGKAEKSILSELVYVETVKIHRGFPNRLTISVTAAKPTVSFAFGGKYYVISENKRLLEISDTAPDCPVVKGVQMMVKSDETENAVTSAAADDGAASAPIETSKEGITLQDGEKELKPGVALGDTEDKKVALALLVVKYMREYELDGKYEINLADSLNIKINYNENIEIELGSASALDEKIYHASRIIEEDVAEGEKCTLNVANPERVVKRPVYETRPEPEVTEAATTEPDTTAETTGEEP